MTICMDLLARTSVKVDLQLYWFVVATAQGVLGEEGGEGKGGGVW